MANLPRVQVAGLPGIQAEEGAATTSPARGAEMLNFLQSRLQKNRAPPLVHGWDFWHDRQDRAANPDSHDTPPGTYEDRLEPLAHINDVRQFWSVFNNFDVAQLKLRDSVHLFHKGVKPVWEDPRNARGGSWTFRVPKSQAGDFWKEICMMAIGEQLQNAVEDPARQIFRDDICGVSLGVRFNSMLVQIWNRDGCHAAGIERIAQTVLEGISEGMKPREGSYYYKKHDEHAGFANVKVEEPKPVPSQVGGSQLREVQSMDAVLNE
ncbi:related to translation initiation factor 4e [Ramularia collo-cygni]|uniref:Related to translation initiation factor 4e n=1 Tax=Ramularia collo-cygni TaxID=112498 RepID=A0A2D3UUL9_9PEZI|nr:related to translation initiation factor 4e [Ramularia collo-cygni]CZT18888.1 related to translation initiation factor 4e [Ramularia collo-cygni]